LQARADHAAGRLSDADLRHAEDAAIADFVALQERLRFKVATDGEFRRGTYTANFTTSGLICDCARHVDIDRLAVSPQCGFSSSDKAKTIMGYDEAVAKLRRVREVARQVWGE